MEMIDVYTFEGAERVLYDLLRERDPAENISHRDAPRFEAHCAFVASRPYQAWYLVVVDGDVVGSIFLTKPPAPSQAGDEIAVRIFQKFKAADFSAEAIRLLMEKHGPRRYLANVSPGNAGSISTFEGLGFVHIQNTYEFRRP